MSAKESALDMLCRLLDEADVTVTLSAHCRTGLVGGLCRCWRCRGLSGPAEDESAAERDATVADAAHRFGFGLGRKELARGPFTSACEIIAANGEDAEAIVAQAAANLRKYHGKAQP